jgi:predicted small secreted protein
MKPLLAIVTVIVAVLLALGLSGCNTVKGMGQDLQKAGESIEGAVKKK